MPELERDKFKSTVEWGIRNIDEYSIAHFSEVIQYASKDEALHVADKINAYPDTPNSRRVEVVCRTVYESKWQGWP